MGSVTAGLEIDLSAQLCAAINGLSARLDRDTQRRQAAAQRASQIYRQIPFVINLTISSSAGSLNPVPACGPPIGYFWSIRRFSATGFTAGTVILFIDSTSGEPIETFTGASIGSYIQTYGKGHQVMHPGSNLAITATGITGTVTVYGAADQLETAYFPAYAAGTRED
jgi:hypothetical protein